jgi:hypothetical protein
MERRIDLGSYKSPLLELQRIQEMARESSEKFLNSQLASIAGVDEFGNVILNTTSDLEKYIDVLEQTRISALAKSDVDVGSKFVEDLTTEGSKVAQEIGAFISELPLVGDINIGQTPFKMLQEATDQVNSLLNLKAEYPLSASIQKQLDQAVGVLNEAKGKFDETFMDFRRTVSEIYTQGLRREGIVSIFRDDRLRAGFELIAEYEKELHGLKVTAEDVIGREIMSRIYSDASTVLDIDATRMIERAREAGTNVEKVMKEGSKVFAGEIVTFLPEMGRTIEAAGDFAIAKVNATGQMVLEFYNNLTGKLEVRPFDDAEIQDIADSIIPVRRLQRELEDRVNALNATIIGAAAGIEGTKENLDLGARFYSELDTATLLQTRRGFVPGMGYTQESPLKTVQYATRDIDNNLVTTQKNFLIISAKFFCVVTKLLSISLVAY